MPSRRSRGSRPPSSRISSGTGAGAGGSGGRSGSAATPGEGPNSSSCGARGHRQPRASRSYFADPGKPRRRRWIARGDLLHQRAPAGVGLLVGGESGSERLALADRLRTGLLRRAGVDLALHLGCGRGVGTVSLGSVSGWSQSFA